MGQLEEDRSEAQRMLNQERSARALQEGVLSSHLRKQKEIEEENRRNFNKSTEVNTIPNRPKASGQTPWFCSQWTNTPSYPLPGHTGYELTFSLEHLLIFVALSPVLQPTSGIQFLNRGIHCSIVELILLFLVLISMGKCWMSFNK